MVEATLDLERDAEHPEVIVPWVEALVADGQHDRAHRFLEQTAERLSPREVIGAAIVARRLRDSSMAFRPFEVAGPETLEDHRALLESAQNIIWLAMEAYKDGCLSDNRKLLQVAWQFLGRLWRMDAQRRRHAWAWWELGRARQRLGEPASAVDEAYENATKLAPDETRLWKEWGR